MEPACGIFDFSSARKKKPMYSSRIDDPKETAAWLNAGEIETRFASPSTTVLEYFLGSSAAASCRA
jgi:hypothetical protein